MFVDDWNIIGRRVFGDCNDDVQIVDDLIIIGNGVGWCPDITMKMFGLLKIIENSDE